MTVDEIDNEYAQIRMIAIDLLDEILAEARDAQKGIGDEEEHQDAQGDALIALGDGHDPKMVARALIIAIGDRLSAASS
jgi:hypothetical protein